jgi:mRNA-degrading endonuclease toxin of MazEF toxin-antitoxin module
VARRADVLVARRRLGFGADGRREHFVVLQSDLLGELGTVIVAPLDEHASMYDDDPLAVQVSAKETGSKGAQVVLVHLLAAISSSKFEVDTVGRLSTKAMTRIDEVLCTALGL